MNDAGKHLIDDLVEQLAEIDIEIETIFHEEEDRFEEMTKRQKQTKKGKAFEKVFDLLTSARSKLYEAITALQGVKNV